MHVERAKHCAWNVVKTKFPFFHVQKREACAGKLELRLMMMMVTVLTTTTIY